MKIKSIKTYRLCNKEHYLLMTKVKNLIEASGSKNLKIENTFNNFIRLHGEEDLLLKNKNQSIWADKIEESDSRRDDYLRGITLIVKGYLRHEKSEIRKSAETLKGIIDKYGDLRPLSYDDETRAINEFCLDMEKQKYLLQKLNLTEWIDMLKKENKNFQQYVDKQGEEFTAKQNKIKSIRTTLDQSYKVIKARVQALSLMEESNVVYTDFINKLNKVIDHHNGNIFKKTSNIHQPFRTTNVGVYFHETFY